MKKLGLSQPPNKQLQRTVKPHRGVAASAPFRYALASRITRQRAAAELRRYAQFRGRNSTPTAAHNSPMAFDLSEDQLERAERILGARFPEAYRQIILRHNGGVLNVRGDAWKLIPILDDRSQFRLSKTCEDVLGWTDQFRMWSTWPKGAIAIARNGFGDAVLFLKEGGRIYPSVYVWWHETGTLEKIASDFADVPSA